MVKPDFRESLTAVAAMQLLGGESRYMAPTLILGALGGADLGKQRPCTSIDTRNPCEMRRDCCYPTEAQRAQAKAENEAAARAAGAVFDTLGGGPSYQKQNPDEVWAGQGEKMGKATTQHESTLHLAAAAERAPAPRARADVANTLLWLGDGRGAPPPQMLSLIHI